jgi:HAD superfamily hydrolase (TIGR01509 family)
VTGAVSSLPAGPLPVGPLPAALLFDMDGLLVDTERTWFAVESEVMADLGAPWGSEHQEALVGGPLEKSVSYMLEHAGRPDVSPDLLARTLLEGMVRHLRAGPVRWQPGAERLLAQAAGAGVPCALVSSSLRPVVDAVLDAIGSRHFAVTVSGDDVARTKPEPDPYLRAAELLGVDPTRCVALEDSETGAASAVAAGCLTVVVPSLVPVPADLGHHRAASLSELDLSRLGELAAART